MSRCGIKWSCCGDKRAGGSVLGTSIGCFWSSLTAGFLQSFGFLPSFSRRQSFVSIVPAFAATGVGNPVRGAGGRPLRLIYAL
jgi:hypothetical protein